MFRVFKPVSFLAIALSFALFSAPSFSGSKSAPEKEMGSPEVGKAAPTFKLKGADGKDYDLTQFKGKTVVLEWWNHQCPYVKKHYGAGNMQALQKEFTKDGAVWLTIVSSAPGTQGHVEPSKAMELMKESKAMQTAVLLDPTGDVGRMYGARTTPHMFVINKEGNLFYKGAIDDKPTADKADIKGAQNYVKEAFNALKKGRTIAQSSTKPYGCGVKYE